MASNDTTVNIKKFKGLPREDFNIWKLRVEQTLKGKGLWKALNEGSPKEEVKEKACLIIVDVIGDDPFRVCQSALGDPLEMLKILTERYASKRTANRVALLSAVFSKRYKKKTPMNKYIDEFNTLFSQLESMGKEHAIPEGHKPILLMSSMGKDSPLEGTLAALRMKDSDYLTWDSVCADLIQESECLKSYCEEESNYRNKHVNEDSRNKDGRKKALHGNRSHKANSMSSSQRNCTCEFCGLEGHAAPESFQNPDSPNCKLTEKSRKNIKALSSKRKGRKQAGSESLNFGGYAAKAAKRTSNNLPCLDSGATISMFKTASEAFPGSYKQGSNETVQLAAGEEVSRRLGSATLELGNILVNNAVHVEGLNSTLVSVGDLCDASMSVVFTAKEALILDTTKFSVKKDLVEARVPRLKNGLYCFTQKSSKVANNATSEPKNDSETNSSFELWHKRFIHANAKVVKNSYKSMDNPSSLKNDLKICHPCQLGKAHKQPFKSSFENVEEAGEVVHSDLSGPLPVSTYGSKYVCTFVDQFTRYMNVACLEGKDDAKLAYVGYKSSSVTKHFKNGVQRLHTDGGGEYYQVSENDSDLEHTTTTPETPEHNPFAERTNRTLMDPVRTLLEEAGLSAKYWEDAVDHVAYVKNGLYNKALKCSPYEKLTGKKPKLNHLRVFGCAAFVLKRNPESKVHARAAPAIHLGCDDNGVYRLQDLTTGKTKYSRHVTFDELSFPGLEQSDSSSSGEEGDDFEEGESKDSSDKSDSESDSESDSDDDDKVAVKFPGIPARPLRTRKKPVRFADEYAGTSNKGKGPHIANKVISIPITTSDNPSVREALELSTPEEQNLWIEAIKEELDTMNGSGTWKAVKKKNIKTLKKKPLPTHIVLRIKRNADGLPTRFKARVVAGGHLQVKCKDFEAVYSPVVDFGLVRLVMILVMSLSWYTRHLDVKAAFLNGEIDREVYVHHPVNLPRHLRISQVYLLLKSLYGLHQAPLAWFKKLMEELVRHCYKQLASDGSVFIRVTKTDSGSYCIVVLVYVDDLIFVGNDEGHLEEATREFLSVFEGTNDGPVNWYLGVSIENTEDSCTFSQAAYTREILREHKMEEANPVYTPMTSNFYDELDANKTQPLINDAQYRAIIGSLLFLSTRTRPDIAPSVGILSQFVACPTRFLLDSAKRVLRYLKGTITFVLVYNRGESQDLSLSVHTDADFAQDKSDRKSRSGYIAMLQGNAFNWWSKKQNCTALFTAEAEYVAMSESCKEINWLRLFMAEIHQGSSEPTQLCVDNQAARAWSESERSMRKAKHIDIRHHFVKECYKRGSIKPEHVPSEENFADGFTKPLDRTKFELWRNRIGVRSINTHSKEE